MPRVYRSDDTDSTDNLPNFLRTFIQFEILIGAAFMTVGGFVLRVREDYSFIVVGLTMTLLGLYRLRSYYTPSKDQRFLDEDRVLNRLKHSLDANYSVVRKYSLPDDNVDVPYLVLGPPGLVVLHRWDQPGEIRSENGTWVVESDGESERHDNPLTDLERDVQFLESFLRRKDEERVPVQGRLVLMKHTAEGEVMEDERVVFLRDLPGSLVPETGEAPLNWEAIDRLEDVLELAR
jgi:hypothetical protein